jgi:serine/threonine protein kinase
MIQTILLNTLANSQFYESIDYYQPQEDQLLTLVRELLPDDWQFSRKGVWFGSHPPDEMFNRLPAHGWKIHVSSSISNARDILKAIVPILARHNINFKFTLDLHLLTLMNGKAWGRQGAGKFVTVYPLDEEQFKFLIEELYQATRQFDGLYILSDRRYKDGKVIFYRYGGIRPDTAVNAAGESVHMLVSPEGERVPDQRVPYFQIPPWAKDPFENAASANSEQQADTSEITLKEGQYLVKNVFGYSNSGGVYLAENRETGQDVVIKEARPFVTTTEDAVSLLRKEYRILSKIAHTGLAPQPVDFFQDWEHSFLVQEYLTGEPLMTFSARNNITLLTSPTREKAQKFFENFKTIFLQLAEAVRIMHEHKMVLGDLSPSNIIILPDTLELKIIDFESAFEIDVDKPIFLYTPGFAYVDQMTGRDSTFESDYFSLGAIMHFFLAPVNRIFVVNPRARFTFIDSVIRDIGFPPSIGDMIMTMISNAAEKRPTPAKVIEVLRRDEEVTDPSFSADGPEANPIYQSDVERISDYILAMAIYERKDRLFPAYSKIFDTNPMSLAYGACGTVYALRRMGKELPGRLYDWIRERNLSIELYPPGLYLGLSGIAWTMLELGMVEESQKVLKSTYEHPLLYQSHNIFRGIAGWGLANLKFFLETRNEAYLRKAEEAGDHLLATFTEDEKGCYWKSGGEAALGYAHGASGVSLFLLYLYLSNGVDKFLETGISALDFDLNNASPNLEDGLSWKRVANQGSIVYPYWEFGSAGVGTALLRYYRLLGGERYKDVLEKICIDTNRKYAAFPGYFMGLAGLGEFNLDMYQLTGERRHLDGAYRVASGISLFKIEKEEGIAFPGDGLMRICCDLGTGSAGVGHFLNRLVNEGEGCFLLDQLFGERQKVQPVESLEAAV